MYKQTTFLILSCLLLVLTNSVIADTNWTGTVSSDWYNASNWTGTVPTSGDVTLIESLNPITWPVLDGGIASSGELRIGYTANYQGELTVTGGATLTVSGEMRIGRKSNNGSGQAIGTLNISGSTTTITVTDTIENGRHGHGTINMNGGYLHCNDALSLAYRFDGTGTVYLNGGTIDLGGNPGIIVYGNDGVPGTALIDISGGILTLAGNQVSTIEDFINEGIIIGYGGEGGASVTFDAPTGNTIVTAIGGPSAMNPIPADGQNDLPRDIVLGWKPGTGAVKHDVYFGTMFAIVDQATTTLDPLGVYKGRIDPNTFTNAELLEFGQTYYWRVDEVGASGTIKKGDVWSFTVELFSYPIENISATASSSEDNKGPENTINGSGLDSSGLLHSNESIGNMWQSSRDGAQPTWIEYEFDKVYKVYELWVWNSNDSLESLVGFGFKDVTIEYSTNGIDYMTLGTTHEFTRAPGTPNYEHNTTVNFGGVAAKYVRLTANSNWGGIFNQYGLSEVRFFYIPVHAKNPYPDSGATGVAVDVTLGWQPGRGAAKHDVHLSTDEQAVVEGNAFVNTVNETSYSPLNLNLASIYYWRIDEVNDADTPTTWQGDIWSFSTQEYLVVEDFESYNDIPAGEEGSNLVYNTWADGYDNPANGSTIGYNIPFQPTIETSIVYEGLQSVPLIYDNTVASYSEATANIADLSVGGDWSIHGIKALTLRFFGDPNNVLQQMYVKINDSKVEYDGQAENLQRLGWQMWYVDLSLFGTNLSNVTKLSVGFERIGTTGGQGMILLDGIRLYSYDRQMITPVDPGTTGLQAHYEFEGNYNDSSGNARHGAAMGNPTFVTGKVGQAINLRGVNDYVTIPGYKGVLGTSAVTVTAWINTTSVETGTIVGWGPSVDGQRFGFRINDNRLRMEVSGGNVQGVSNVNDGKWHHVAVTIQENSTISYPDVVLYVDGMDNTIASVDTQALNLTAAEDVRIGSRPASDDRFFMGMIDNVLIYDRMLTPEEIAGLSGRTQPYDKPF